MRIQYADDTLDFGGVAGLGRVNLFGVEDVEPGVFVRSAASCKGGAESCHEVVGGRKGIEISESLV